MMAVNEQSLQPAENTLTLIDNMNVAAVAATMNKIAQFQAIVQKTLKDGHDYGVIPGTKIPTLLKPGAEKILMLMGLTSEYEVTESVRDYETGFFAFTVTCKLSHNGYAITEGVGHCNTKERRYQGDKQDPYTLANTVLKMAKKRSLVDAALTVASLSDIFTQDMEDLASNGHEGTPAPSHNSSLATNKQLNFLQQQAEKKGLTGDAFNAWVESQAGKPVEQITRKEASTLIDAIKSYKPEPKPAESQQAPKQQDAKQGQIDFSDDPFADVPPLTDQELNDLPF